MPAMPDIWLSQLKKYRAIAVIRSSEMRLAREMAMAVASGGIKLIEITWNTDGVRDLIPQLRRQLPDCMIGTGTLLNVWQLKEAINAGAEFLFSPHLDTAMIDVAVNHHVPIVPGALTPTEIVTAWSRGASCVKVFPVMGVGGVKYIKSLQGPLGEIPLIPTGGVTIANAGEFIQAGAVGVGLSGELFPLGLVKQGNWTAITQLADELMQGLNNWAMNENHI